MSFEPISPDELPSDMVRQSEYWAGMVAGYAFATGVELWACCDGPSFFIDHPTSGTRSHRILRAGLTKTPDMNAAFRGLIDSIASWPKAEPLGNLPSGDDA